MIQLENLSVQDGLDELLVMVEEAFETRDFNRIHQFLCGINPTDLSVDMLISILRSTSRAKQFLPNWNIILSATKQRVQEEQLPTRLLRGLEEHTTQINTLLADLSKLHSILSDPESVFIYMKAGRIAKPSLRSILELYDPHEFNHSENPSLTQR